MVEYLPVKNWPKEERPREKLLSGGARQLSNAELLAIILRTGTANKSALTLAQELLAEEGGLVGLGKASPSELSRKGGIGEAKAAQVLAALELGRRCQDGPWHLKPITNPQDAVRLLQAEMNSLPQEEMRVILLNSKNCVVAIRTIYKGTVNKQLVRVAELFREAVRENCPAIIIVHNHPSGDPTPSAEDRQITTQIIEAGQLMDIEVLDHLILGQNRYVSLKEEGLVFAPGGRT